MMLMILEVLSHLKIGSGEGWSKLLVNEESVAMLLNLVVDTRNGLLEHIYRVFELLVGHHNRLLLDLPHDGLVDQREQVLDE